MNTSVSIGSSQDFKLSQVLLIYGKSSYDFVPYRYPFLSVHEVIHDEDGARLSEGQLVTPQMLADLLVGLGRFVPLEILPAGIVVRTPDTIVWWTRPRQRMMFFSDRGGDLALKALNGKIYPHPPLVFKACGGHLWVRAMCANQRPTAATKLHLAPYWNTYQNGAVCVGSMKVPQSKSVSVTDDWEGSFFQSEFTHAGGIRNHTKYPGGILTMWQSLQRKKRFPTRYLVETKQTLAEFVNDDGHEYRNE